MGIDQIYEVLTKAADIPLIKASHVARYVQSPISFWCDVHAPLEEKDSIDPYQQHLFEVGQGHQSDIAAQEYPDAVQEVFVNEEEGFRRTLKLMSGGEQAIENMPLIGSPVGLEGRPDFLEKRDGLASDLGDYSYVVVEVKSARNIRRHDVLQAAAYNRLVGLVQGNEPIEFYIINRDGSSQVFRMSDVVDELDTVLAQMRGILGGSETVEPVFGSGRWPWEGYVDRLAVAKNDVSLIPGISLAKRRGLVAAGYRTVEQIASAEIDSLVTLKGVGELTARKYVTSAKAIRENRPVRRAKTARLPSVATEVFFDLEGTDPRIGAEGLEVVNYLIGAVVRQAHAPPAYVPFFAPTFEDEKRILTEFFEWASSLDDPAFIHWHHYERTHLTKMASHYGLSEELVTPVIEQFFDLSPATTKAFAFPAYGEGLKDVARSLGFSWRQEDVSALSSVVLYLNYVDSGGTELESRQKILDYNEDDCMATLYIFDWLRSQ